MGKQDGCLDGTGLLWGVERGLGVPREPKNLALTFSCHLGYLCLVREVPSA